MEEVNGGLIKLICCVKKSDWGRIGQESTVARLYYRNTGINIDQNQPYAEFWMGTHESGPSYVGDTENLTLKEWIERNPSVLGETVLNKWGTDFPFLFKELKVIVRTTPEIVEVVGNSKAEQVLILNDDEGKEEIRLLLQSVFTDIMTVCKDVTAEVLAKLISRLNFEGQARHLTEKEQLILQLEKQYPADVGVLAAYLLNYVKLNPGEALYLGSNEPHAYLYGESVECMANSDNVIRAGLTPKQRDVKILCSMLTYKQGFPDILKGTVVNPYTKRYLPPFDEFEVDRCILPQNSTTVFASIPGPSIFLVVEGEGTMTTSSNKVVAEGDVLFASANTSITVATMSGLHLCRAGVSSRLFELHK